jgi:hypothetical protein
MLKAISYILFKQGIISGHKNMGRIGMVFEHKEVGNFLLKEEDTSKINILLLEIYKTDVTPCN